MWFALSNQAYISIAMKGYGPGAKVLRSRVFKSWKSVRSTFSLLYMGSYPDVLLSCMQHSNLLCNHKILVVKLNFRLR